MGKEKCAAVDEKNRLLFFLHPGSDLICLSGQTAQLVPASAAGLQFGTHIITVNEEKMFVCRLRLNMSGQAEQGEQDKELPCPG
jgi:hypothetical protein